MNYIKIKKVLYLQIRNKTTRTLDTDGHYLTGNFKDFSAVSIDVYFRYACSGPNREAGRCVRGIRIDVIISNTVVSPRLLI